MLMEAKAMVTHQDHPEHPAHLAAHLAEDHHQEMEMILKRWTRCLKQPRYIRWTEVLTSQLQIIL